MPVPLTARAVTGAFLVSGVVHLVKPEVFEPLVPEQLPGGPRPWVTWSGVAELACAGGMLHPRTRRVAAYASAALLVGVLPGNLKMALDAQRGDNAALKAGTLARIPLQVPMIRGMLKAARSA
ncbi:DoxX family protein [Nocardioides nitrophenolicus]|uniref:DoxX family protein n=1 Tax=Nocardioides nitrophenolicus TaxID=60489 RepID=UPI001959880C|nr:DoxX family protein [Nocardioides nitrophenolicus]MBM7515448.1 putative membrane protein [Nocardioides nitrophenolicus]